MILTKKNSIHFIKSILNSYSQVFFSDNILFALLLIAVTFFDLNAGISGLIAVIFSNLLAYIIGFNRHYIKCGYYGFNSLLVGLGFGVHFHPNLQYFFLLIFAAMLTLFITIMLEGVIGKYGLPFLSLPFLIATWLLVPATNQFRMLIRDDRSLAVMLEIFQTQGNSLTHNYFNFFDSVLIYFKSLGAIFFQYNLIAGIIIAIGILFYSRIAFLLSLLSFYSAFLYYYFIGANITELCYNYIGFNFILTAIAIGGIFIVPSKSSFLWVILLTPLISVVVTSTYLIFSYIHLPILSLPFNIIVLLFIYILKFRKTSLEMLEPVVLQQNSPEKNLYFHINNKHRFIGIFKFPFSLPFKGEWHVSQGNNGEQTHKDDWKHAWDFVIKDEEEKTYKSIGNQLDDFYAYKKPVTAPADGWIDEVVDIIEDNDIADVNVSENWGNTVVIRHSDQLYSQLSHLAKGSIKVFKGSYIKKGDVIGYCGNSGRSPEPHIHFQVQSTPFIGSKTLSYPISHYIVKKENNVELKSFTFPQQNEIVSNIEKNKALEKAFHFIPGQKLSFLIEKSGESETVNWEVKTDIYNNSYIYCEKNKSKAYFVNQDDIHYFTKYEGKQSDLLFYFYLSSYKILLGFYQDLVITDAFPLTLLNKNIFNILQDFIAPFYFFIHSDYKMTYEKLDEYLDNYSIKLKSNTQLRIGNFVIKNYTFEIYIENNKIFKIKIQ